MAARAHREAQRLTRFRKIVLIYLVISFAFARFSYAKYIYSIQSLLDINNRCSNIVLDHPFDFSELPPELLRSPLTIGSLAPTGSARRRRRDRKQRRGKRGGLRVKLKLNPHRPALPSIFLVNVRSLMNKMDELKILNLTQKWLNDCNVMFITETWLCSDVPNSVVHMDGRSFFRADTVATTSGKNKDGGVCISVNKSWCTDSVVVDTHSSSDLEFLIIKCTPFYLPPEFTCIVAAAVYVPPDANVNVAMKELCAAVSKLQTLHPDGAFIVAGEFNHCTLRSVLPKFHQNVSCTTMGHKTLDHVYTNVTDAYKVTPLPQLGQSDHFSLLLLPCSYDVTVATHISA